MRIFRRTYQIYTYADAINYAYEGLRFHSKAEAIKDARVRHFMFGSTVLGYRVEVVDLLTGKVVYSIGGESRK